MQTFYAVLAIGGYFIAIGATLAASLLQQSPKRPRDHALHLSRLGLIAGCAFSIARLVGPWPVLGATFEEALLAVALAAVMALRADSEVRRQRANAIQ